MIFFQFLYILGKIMILCDRMSGPVWRQHGSSHILKIFSKDFHGGIDDVALQARRRVLIGGMIQNKIQNQHCCFPHLS